MNARFDDPISPIDRVLLRYRESVAQATDLAYRELDDLGVADPVPLLRRTAVGSPDPPIEPRDPAIVEVTRDERVALWTLRLLTAWGVLPAPPQPRRPRPNRGC